MNLKQLESDTIKFLQSIPQTAKKPLMLWSMGKDSTALLYLIFKAFGRIPWPVLHIDTGKKFEEMYLFRERLRAAWNIPLVIARDAESIELGISPDVVTHYDCCTTLKTNVLKSTIKKGSFDAIILAIRHDEHFVRGMEDLMSLRDEEGNWQYKGNFGGFGVTAPKNDGLAHVRCHPILPWTEADVWEYISQGNIPVNPLYFAKCGMRYRSIGCECCTEPIASNAQTIQDIIREVKGQPKLERAGRIQDKESEGAMLRLRALGYM